MKFLLILFILVILVIMLRKRNCHFQLVLLLAQSFWINSCWYLGPLFYSLFWLPSIFLIVVDDFSRFTGIYLLKTKAEVKIVLPNFILLIQNQFSVKLKKLRPNNGREFFLTDFFCHTWNLSWDILSWDSSAEWHCWEKTSTSFKCWSCFVVSI